MYVVSNESNMHIGHLISYVGNNGCGPENAEALAQTIREEAEKAKKSGDSRLICYAGAYDILVFPAGTFCLVPTNLTTYSLVDGP